MTDDRPIRQYSDDQLRSYLDGDAEDAFRAEIEAQLEYDDALQMRLAALDELTPIIRAAADDLLAAEPRDQLAERLRAAEKELAGQSPPEITPGKNRWRAVDLTRAPALATLAASLLLTLAIGAVAGRLIFSSADDGRSQTPAWITAAADHVRLYSAETLLASQRGDAEKSAAVNDASAHLSLDLTPAIEAASSLYFQKTEVLQFEDRPLVELAYLHDTGAPVALYVLAGAEPEPAPRTEPPELISGDIDGMNVGYWTRDGYEFLIVGDLEMDQLARLSYALDGALD